MSVTAASGFEAGGLASGIKPDGQPDLAIVTTADRRAVAAAGVFTRNVACAAPVQVSREHLGNEHATAVVLSSGNANAATGEQGRADARRMAALTGAGLGCEATDVLVCSTGLIGYFMPMAALEQGIPKLAAGLNGSDAAADAILTTDTVRKEAVATVAGTQAVVGGMAKGAAMLAPAMATMLAVVTTDAALDGALLRAALRRAVDDSFNQLCVDACTSTNDTVLVLANGASGVAIGDDRSLGVTPRARRSWPGSPCAAPVPTTTPGTRRARSRRRSSSSARSTARIPTGGASSPSWESAARASSRRTWRSRTTAWSRAAPASRPRSTRPRSRPR